MKRLLKFIVILSILLVNPLLASDREKAKTFIFLLHGIGSTSHSFAHMKEALSHALPKYQDRHYLVSEFNYQTGNDDLTTIDFASDFNRHIEETLLSNEFDERNDKISIIAHSQGGLVSLLWIHQSFHQQYRTSFHQQLDSFITLGTPFWGTSIVLFPMWIRLLAKHFGDQEAREMLWGSQTIDLLEQATSEQNPSFKAYLKTINIVNVGANALVYPNVASMRSIMADDIAVPVPSSNINHFTAHDHSTFYRPGELIDVAKKEELGKFFLAQGLHTLPFTAGKFKYTQGLPQVPKQCVLNEYCQHISYPYVWRGILRMHNTQLDHRIIQKTKSYTLDIELKVDQESMKPDEFELMFTDEHGRLLADTGHKLAIAYQRESEEYYPGSNNKTSLRYIIAGRAPDLAQKKVIISIKHKGNRFLPKRVASFIQAQHTSFIKSKMLRFNDYLANRE